MLRPVAVCGDYFTSSGSEAIILPVPVTYLTSYGPAVSGELITHGDGVVV